MSTETIEAAAGSGTQVEQAEPEQKLEVAPQDEPKAEGQSEESEGDKGLTDEQKTIRKLQRRIERLNGKVGGSARELEMLRAQLATKTEDTPKEPDIEAVAKERAREMLRHERLNTRAAETLKSGKSIEGFQEALETLRDEVPFTDAQKRLTPFFESLMDADNPARLIQYLGNNPDEAVEIGALTPTQIGRRLAKLEDKLNAIGKTSSAPVPLKPVRGAAPDTGGLDEKGISDEEWARRREKALRSR